MKSKDIRSSKKSDSDIDHFVLETQRLKQIDNECGSWGGRITADVRSGSDLTFHALSTFGWPTTFCLHNVDYDVCKSLSAKHGVTQNLG